MLGHVNLAPVHFRRACAPEGPISRVGWTTVDLYGSTVYQANAWLKGGLRPTKRLGLYGDADGTGTASTPAVARYKAISESLERWAYDGTIGGEDSNRFGFKVDPTSAGMAAFPGLLSTPARKAARMEATERSCLIAWSKGLVASRRRSTEWAGVEAVQIDSPAGGVCVILFRKNSLGFYAYGHAAAETFVLACRRALVELGRNEFILAKAHSGNPSKPSPANLFERRCLFFSTPEGHERFLSRVGALSTGAGWQPRILVDAEITGPWSSYAKVWRVLFQPPAQGFLENELDFFLW